MANIKSQIKRNKQNEKRRLRNRVYRGTARIAVRNARSAIETGNAEETQASLMQAISALDKAAEKGVIHKNNAARRKGRLMKAVAALNLETKPAKAEGNEPAKKAAAKKTTKKTAAKKTTKKTVAKKAASGKKSTKKSE